VAVPAPLCDWLMAMLGLPIQRTFDSTTPFIFVNAVTTVAAAYAQRKPRLMQPTSPFERSRLRIPMPDFQTAARYNYRLRHSQRKHRTLAQDDHTIATSVRLHQLRQPGIAGLHNLAGKREE